MFRETLRRSSRLWWQGVVALVLAYSLPPVVKAGEVPFNHWDISTPGADGAQSVFTADVDGDGDMDVLSASYNDDKIAWYENDGGSPPGFKERVISLAADGAQSVFAADVDGDGDMDVLSASEWDDTIAWYENDGSSAPNFTERVISTAADGARSVFVADMDGDGDTDVLSASYNDDKIAWYTDWEVRLLFGSTLSAEGSMESSIPLSFFGGTIVSGGSFSNMASLRGFGSIGADPVVNPGQATFLADTVVVGDYENTGTTTIQNGTLTIIGSLTNSGTIVGAVVGGSGSRKDAGGGAEDTALFVEGDFSVEAGATLVMWTPGQVLAVGGDFDVAIDQNTRFDLSDGELRFVGLGTAVQEVEALSADLGREDRVRPFSIGTLRIGPTPTTVLLVDRHDNDGRGQKSREALYVQKLQIDPGATLENPDCRIYYDSIVNEGTVSHPENVVPSTTIGIPYIRGDTNADGRIDLSDAISTLMFLFAGGVLDCEDAADTNDSEEIDIADAIYLLQYLFAGGPALEQPSPGCGVDPTPNDLTCESFSPCAEAR